MSWSWNSFWKFPFHVTGASCCLWQKRIIWKTKIRWKIMAWKDLPFPHLPSFLILQKSAKPRLHSVALFFLGSPAFLQAQGHHTATINQDFQGYLHGTLLSCHFSGFQASSKSTTLEGSIINMPYSKLVILYCTPYQKYAPTTSPCRWKPAQKMQREKISF